MNGKIIIDCMQRKGFRYSDDYAIIVIDIIRATTTTVTALKDGRRVFPAKTLDEAFRLASKLKNPLLVGELGGHVPYGFHLTNSPVQVAALSQIPSGPFTHKRRPIVLISSSGTQLLKAVSNCQSVYVACGRNYSAVANYVLGRHSKVAILGAGTQGEFRREDQICCAWIAQKLMSNGYQAETKMTEKIITRWGDANPEEFRNGKSADYLRKTGQVHDLEFIIHHMDDVETVPMLLAGEIKDVLQHENSR